MCRITKKQKILKPLSFRTFCGAAGQIRTADLILTNRKSSLQGGACRYFLIQTVNNWPLSQQKSRGYCQSILLTTSHNLCLSEIVGTQPHSNISIQWTDTLQLSITVLPCCPLNHESYGPWFFYANCDTFSSILGAELLFPAAWLLWNRHS